MVHYRWYSWIENDAWLVDGSHDNKLLGQMH